MVTHAVQEYNRPSPHDTLVDRAIPESLVKRFAYLAATHATGRSEDSGWYVENPLLPGVWAEGGTEDEALKELEEVAFEWAILKIQDGDQDFPVIGDIDLNIVARSYASATSNT